MDQCRICGVREEEVWKERCESCWELEKQFEYLVRRSKAHAIKWLHKQLEDLEGSGV